MSSQRKAARLLQLARDIVQLESELAMRRAEFARLADDGEVVPATEAGDTPQPQVPALRPLARTMGLAQRVQSILDLSSRALTAHEIATQLQQPGSVDTVRAVLSKLKERGSVDRVDVGLYRSADGGHRRAAGEDD